MGNGLPFYDAYWEARWWSQEDTFAIYLLEGWSESNPVIHIEDAGNACMTLSERIGQ